MEQSNIFMLKIIFLGAVRVGKSTIAKILTGKYNFTTKDYEMTQGVELYDKTFVTDGFIIDTVLVDTAGHELYNWLQKSVCDENAFYALCFDFTNSDSLRILKEYIDEFNIQKGMLIGCKYDLISRHIVSVSDAERFAANNKLKLHITSTRTTAAEMEALFRDSIMEYVQDAF